MSTHDHSTCKCATSATRLFNRAFPAQLKPDNLEERALATRGYIGKLPETIIRNAQGRVVWDMEQFSAVQTFDTPAPDTVNPSLWEQARLNALSGLFKVADRVYQVRGHDISNISFIEGDTGWIVIDPCCTAEVAAASLDLLHRHQPPRPVVAVIYSHSHADHFGGVTGIVRVEDVQSGKVQIIAPAGFTEATVSEKILAGNVMARRATYMFGSLLTNGPTGLVDSGVGKRLSMGESGLIAPTHDIGQTGERLIIDGLEVVFQLTPETEAPANMVFHFPQLRSLYLADNALCTLHNLYTPRGAQVRDALAWANCIDESASLFGEETDALFIGHNWPRWGKAQIGDFLRKQSDAYRFIHDQTLRLANQGQTMDEIAETLELPESLRREWYLRPYYSTVGNNARAVYQRYLGWFDGNPANLHPLPPVEAGRNYVELAGGAEALLAKARQSFEAGDYRWVAELVNHLVFAEPGNIAARELQADTLEQLGYQAESAVWRNFYLTGAQELRHGVRNKAGALLFKSRDLIEAIPLNLLFAHLATRLNSAGTEGKSLFFNFRFSDTGQNYVVSVENSVLRAVEGSQHKEPTATITLLRADFLEIIMGNKSFETEISAGSIIVEGSDKAFQTFLELFDEFEFWFNIVEP